VFNKIAPVKGVKLIKDKTTQGSLGFAFVEFADVSVRLLFAIIIALNGFVMLREGCSIYVATCVYGAVLFR